MTRDELAAIAVANLPLLRRFIRRRASRLSEHLLDDCAQQGVLEILENWEGFGAEIAAGADATKIIIRAMRRACDRFLYAEMSQRASVSLNQPIGSGEGSSEVGILVEDGRALDPGTAFDARRCLEAMAQLDGREARILLAFADDVPLETIANEHGVTVLEILSIKVCAAEKVRAAAFARVMTRRTHRPLRSFDMSRFGKPEHRADALA